MRSPARSTTRCVASSRRPTSAPRRSSPSTKQDLTKISEILVKRETIEKEEFQALLDGKNEQEVFGAEEPPAPELPIPPRPADRAGREAPRPLPRPGLAGGTADMRGSDHSAADLILVGAASRRIAESGCPRGRLSPDGDRQRHPRLVLRRWVVPGRAGRRSGMALSWSSKARTSSTSAANRHARCGARRGGGGDASRRARHRRAGCRDPLAA